MQRLALSLLGGSAASRAAVPFLAHSVTSNLTTAWSFSGPHTVTSMPNQNGCGGDEGSDYLMTLFPGSEARITAVAGVGFYWIRFAMGTLGTDALCTFYENDRLLQQFHANASYHQDDCSELQLHAWKYSADTNPILVVAVPGSSGDTALSELLKGPQFQLIGALVDLGNHEPPPETQLDIAFTGPSTITSPPSSTSETPPDAKHGDQTSVTTGWSTLIGPIIGAVLGAVVLVVVASALIYSCRARRRRFARAEQTMSGETGELLGSRPSAGYTLDRSISGRLVMSAGDDATDADLETTQNRKEPTTNSRAVALSGSSPDEDEDDLGPPPMYSAVDGGSTSFNLAAQAAVGLKE